MLNLFKAEAAPLDTTKIPELLSKLLLEPSQELKDRKSNKFRASLVRTGAELGRNFSFLENLRTQKNLSLCAEAIEYLHLGSLIVDDIQDDSPVRRDGVALHTKLGVPHALSVGNWLYFHALKTLSKLDMHELSLFRLQKEWLDAIEEAHQGQVMDLATRVTDLPLNAISEVCYFTALYKTGCISGLSMTMGARVADLDEEHLTAIRTLGRALGVYLQELNDLGNVLGTHDPQKRFEDLGRFKPSFMWKLVLEELGEKAYSELLEACLNLPETKFLEKWLKDNPLRELAHRVAHDAFSKELKVYRQKYPKSKLDSLLALKQRIEKAYE